MYLTDDNLILIESQISATYVSTPVMFQLIPYNLPEHTLDVFQTALNLGCLLIHLVKNPN